MIEVRIVNISSMLSAQEIEKLASTFDEKKKNRIKKFRFLEDKKRCLLGEVLLRVMLWQLYKLNWRNLDFEQNEFGKPEISSLENIHFNISHSGRFVCCAISDYPIGIDIEKVDSDFDFSLFTSTFSQEEKDYIYKDINRVSSLYRFYSLWTLKESYIKKIGLGLSKDLKSFKIIPLNGNFNARDEKNKNLPELFELCTIEGEYYISVCYETKDKITMKKFMSDKLLEEYKLIPD